MSSAPRSLILPVRKLIKRAIYFEPLNVVVRTAMRPFRGLLPQRVLHRIPLVGTLSFRLPDLPLLKLSVKGLDDVAVPLYWHGPDACEGATLRIFARLLEGAEIVFDVGAYIGVYALLAGLYESSKVVYAFEPMPEVADALRRNVAVNGLDNVHVENFAAASQNGETTLFIPRAGLPSSSSTREGFRDARRRIKVPTVKLDSFVDSTGIPRVDLIKIDTETTEPEVLEGARAILKRDRPVVICEVLAGHTEDELNRILGDLDYRYFWITPEGLVRRDEIEGDPNYQHNNYLFVPASKLGQVE